jgi:hypothetical protein
MSKTQFSQQDIHHQSSRYFFFCFINLLTVKKCVNIKLSIISPEINWFVQTNLAGMVIG